VGQATSSAKKAKELILAGRAKLETLRGYGSAILPSARLLHGWLDPVYASGHWMPEMVEIAGGFDALAGKGG